MYYLIQSPNKKEIYYNMSADIIFFGKEAYITAIAEFLQNTTLAVVPLFILI
jgi:hypothetical protein